MSERERSCFKVASCFMSPDPISFSEAVGLIDRFWIPTKKLLVFCWLRYFPLGAFNVAISIQPSKNSSKYLCSELIKRIEEEVVRLGVDSTLRVGDIGAHTVFKNDKDAENYRNKTKLDLIVWGRFTECDLVDDCGKKFVKIETLKFTCGYPRDPQNKIGSALKNEFSIIAAQATNLRITDRSDSDLNRVKDSITNISFYITAKCLALFGERKSSIEVFKKLLLRFNQDCEDNLFRFTKLNLWDQYIDFYVKASLAENHQEGLKMAHEIEKLFPNEETTLVSLAFCNFMLGSLDEARKISTNLFVQHPNSVNGLINKAFFCMLDNRQDEAFSLYERIQVLIEKGVNINPIPTIKFFDEYYEKDKKPCFLYANGLLNFYFKDRERGIELLKRFLSEAREPIYKKMVKKASGLLPTR